MVAEIRAGSEEADVDAFLEKLVSERLNVIVSGGTSTGKTELGRKLLELGRSCVHPDYRGGTGMFLLWNGLAEYVLEHRIEILFGVASFHGTDVEALRMPLSLLYHQHLAPPELRVRALPEHFQRMDLVPAAALDRRAAVLAMPALIKAYLRLGGFVGDGAFVDHAFNTTDVCLLMDTAAMSEKHKSFYTRKHVGRGGDAGAGQP